MMVTKYHIMNNISFSAKFLEFAGVQFIRTRTFEGNFAINETVHKFVC